MTQHILFVIEAASYLRDGRLDVKLLRHAYEVKNDVIKLCLNDFRFHMQSVIIKETKIL